MALSLMRRAARIRHLADTARALVAETGDAGFSMALLAARAGVSAATPYNLVGTKSDIVRLVVHCEFVDFGAKLGAIQHDSPMAALLDATALVVTHYAADPRFYRGLFRATFGMEASDVHDVMLAEGRALWVGFVADAVAAGELQRFVEPQPLTDVLLRTIGVTTQAWLAEGWDEARFALEIAYGVRLALAGVASPAIRDRLVAEIAAAQTQLAAPADSAALRAGCGR
jgi:AcrR family transcriptional regulator